MTAPQRRPGRTPKIGRDQIADAAIEVVREHGVSALTLQAVASKLGVQHSALYRHLEGRDALQRAIAERFVELAKWPEPRDDWREYLRDIARAIDRECGQVPGMMDLIYNRVWPLPAPLLETAKRSAEHLVSLGFSHELALVAVDLVADLAAEARVREDQLAQRPEGWAEVARKTVPGGAGVQQQARLDALLSGSLSSLGALKLEIVLDGIDARRISSAGTATDLF